MKSSILDNLHRLEKGEKARFSLLWEPSDPKFLKFTLDGISIFVTRAVRWPMIPSTKHLDIDRLRDGMGELVWLAFGNYGVEDIRVLHMEFPLLAHDILIHCSDAHYQQRQISPCRQNVLTKALLSDKDLPVVHQAKDWVAKKIPQRAVPLSALETNTFWAIEQWAERNGLFHEQLLSVVEYPPQIAEGTPIPSWIRMLGEMYHQMRGSVKYPDWTEYDPRIGDPIVYEKGGKYLVQYPNFYGGSDVFGDAPIAHFTSAP